MTNRDHNSRIQLIAQQQRSCASDSGSVSAALRRRTVLSAGVGLAAAALLLNTARPLAEKTAMAASPDSADVDIAALGDILRNDQPSTAANLERLARIEANLPAQGELTWAQARQARSVLMTKEKIAAELAAGDVLFVTGWLLVQSEASVALLYSSAASSRETVSQDNPSR